MQGVVALSPVQRVILARDPQQQIIATATHQHALTAQGEFGGQPHGPIGKHHTADLRSRTGEPALDTDGIATIGVRQHQVIPHLQHTDIISGNTSAKAYLTLMLDTHSQAIIDDYVLAIPQVEEIDIVLTATLQGVIA